MRTKLLVSVLALMSLTACGGGSSSSVLPWVVSSYNAVTPTTAAGNPTVATVDASNTITLAAGDQQTFSGDATIEPTGNVTVTKVGSSPTYVALSKARGNMIQLCSGGVSKYVLTDSKATKLTSANVAELKGKIFDYYENCAAKGFLAFESTVPTDNTQKFATYSEGSNVLAISLADIVAGMDGATLVGTDIDHLWYYKQTYTDPATLTIKTYYFIAESQLFNGQRIVNAYVAR